MPGWIISEQTTQAPMGRMEKPAAKMAAAFNNQLRGAAAFRKEGVGEIQGKAEQVYQSYHSTRLPGAAEDGVTRLHAVGAFLILAP